MNKKIQITILLILGGLIVAGIILSLPLWQVTDKLPNDVFELDEKEFYKHKDEFQAIAKKLSQECKFQVMDEKREEREWLTYADIPSIYKKYNYQLAVKYGEIHGRESSLFDNGYKESYTSTYLFISFLKPNLPYLIYDHEKHYAYIDPLKLPELKRFAKKIAKEYAYSENNKEKVEQVKQAYLDRVKKKTELNKK